VQFSSEELAWATGIVGKWVPPTSAEPAGALALAGLLAERSWAAGKRVGVIQTGGNVDADLLLQVLSGRTPTA
jgi:threonine dehydratase